MAGNKSTRKKYSPKRNMSNPKITPELIDQLVEEAKQELQAKNHANRETIKSCMMTVITEGDVDSDITDIEQYINSNIARNDYDIPSLCSMLGEVKLNNKSIFNSRQMAAVNKVICLLNDA